MPNVVLLSLWHNLVPCYNGCSKGVIAMDEYTFEDALAGATVTCSFPGLEAVRSNHTQPDLDCTSLFFPGCSFINYALPLVQAVYDLLREAGRVNGMSLLCCGKILQYEPDGATVRAAFEEQFRDRIAGTNITRIVAACPNCVLALRTLLEAEERTAHIQVVPLTVELADMGYRIDAETAADLARQDPRIGAEDPVVFCVKDSCPDRETGEFAESLRQLMPEGMIVDPAHNRSKSVCCGSRPRAAGRMEAAMKSCVMNHDEARAAGANAIVAPCVSCTYLLSVMAPDLPVFHYLELLYDYRIPWDYLDQYMKLRFLFDSSLGAREFYGLDES